MKNTILIVILVLVVFSCKKQDISFKSGEYLPKVQLELKDSVSTTDYNRLDFSGAVLSRVDSINLYILRIPFRGKSVSTDFVVLRTSADGNIEIGKIVHQEGTSTDGETLVGKRKSFNGDISISSLDRKTVLRSPIVNGFITVYHQRTNFRTSTQVVDGVMPEVVITYVIQSNSSFSFSYWVSLQSYFNDNGSSFVGNYYCAMDGSGATGGGPSGSPGSGNLPTGGGGGGGPTYSPPILIDVETMDENEAIDIEKFINCFNNIPDVGATCTIQILSDIPVDNDPNKIFDFGTRSPGHTFINIRKMNMSQSVSQNIGFYPKSGLKTIATNAPVDGKFVDNGLHEFNAGFLLSITPAQLTAALTQMQRAKDFKYDIDNYNCTDWALDVFNAAGGNLQIPLYDIPGNYPSTGTRTPNGVFNKLREMKSANDPRASGIEINFRKAWAGNSTGPCN